MDMSGTESSWKNVGRTDALAAVRILALNSGSLGTPGSFLSSGRQSGRNFKKLE